MDFFTTLKIPLVFLWLVVLHAAWFQVEYQNRSDQLAGQRDTIINLYSLRPSPSLFPVLPLFSMQQ